MYYQLNKKGNETMKRIAFFMMALLLVSGMAMAQGGQRGGNRQMDPKQRAENMTERMVKEYSLNDTQKQKLLEANLAFVEKMSAPQKDANGKREKMSNEDREKMRAEMKKNREDYDAKLKEILTKEQYDTYTKKQAERESKMKNRNGGDRQG